MASRMSEFAVIKTGGKQYKVSEGDVVTIEKLAEESKVGDKVTFDEVLLSDDGKATTVGTPKLSGKKVSGEVVAAGRARKVTVIKYKAKSRYFKKRGHRQSFLKVKIQSIV
jgi:large subunit ribosomal protein L21